MMRSCGISSIFAVAFVVGLCSSAEALPPGGLEAAAMQWILLVDAGEYAKSWDRAGVVFKSSVTAGDWQKRIAPSREPLGAIMTRTVRDETLSQTFPGLPGGKYALIHFNSVFEHNAAALETVTLDMEDSHWTVIGYYIQQRYKQ